jgi:hypothetical protein
MTCDLHSSCGVSYRTYAAYKSHVYRHHSNQLHLKEENINNSNFIITNDNQPLNTDPDDKFDSVIDDVEHYLIDAVENYLVDDDDNDDDECHLSDSSIDMDLSENNKNETNIDPLALYKSSFNKENDTTSISDIQKSFMLFTLQLREEFCLPKTTINCISNYIVTLMNLLHSLLEQKCITCDFGNATQASSSRTTNESLKKVIELETVKSTMDEVCHSVQIITKNEYQFLKYCNQYFKYDPPEQIILSGPDEVLECGYFVPIEQTVTSILRNQHTLVQIIDNVKQQQEATITDNDLMFSFRDGNFGSRIDDNSLLLQLYADEIGLTNPIGAKKHQHKMFMVYFSLEDIPDKYRSQLEHIHLVAICESGILKVKL